MASDQAAVEPAITQAVVETIKAIVQALGVAVCEVSTGPKIDGPTLSYSTFYWCSRDKYVELRNFRLEVNNILHSYNVNNTEK